MQRLSSRIWPEGWHPGGLGWWLGRFDKAADDVAVYRAGGDVVGWASIADEHDATLDVDPGAPDAAAALLEWLGDAAQSALKPRRALWRGVDAAEYGLPPGYAVRATRADEVAERVEVHRAAWLPAALPYAPGHQPDFPPGATSNFTGEVYERVRSLWLYDPELDLVAEAPDGTLAACCIGWFDPAIGVTEIEPLGVRPEHRRLGLAGALCLEVAKRTASRGGREVFINAEPSEEYPASSAAYLKAGFELKQYGSVLRRP
jgi:GNAT superfamily N-acetyltransferase